MARLKRKVSGTTAHSSDGMGNVRADVPFGGPERYWWWRHECVSGMGCRRVERLTRSGPSRRASGRSAGGQGQCADRLKVGGGS